MDKIYYIIGSSSNPESVKRALREVCPEAENIDDFNYSVEAFIYYCLDGRIAYAHDYSHFDLLRHVGEELQPILEEKVKFRLPTKEDFENLISHFSRWDDKRKGLEIENANHEILFLPAAGQCLSLYSSYDTDSLGYYWSSTTNEDNNNYVYYLGFFSNSKYMSYDDRRYHRRSVRLVSDEPFEGCIEFNGTYWKHENEFGYYSHAEALEKFNK